MLIDTSGHHLRVRTSYVIKKIAEFVGMENRFLPIVRRPEVLGATAYLSVIPSYGWRFVTTEHKTEIEKKKRAITASSSIHFYTKGILRFSAFSAFSVTS